MSFSDYLFKSARMTDKHDKRPKITDKSSDEERLAAFQYFKKKRTLAKTQFKKTLNSCHTAIDNRDPHTAWIQGSALFQKLTDNMTNLRLYQEELLELDEDEQDSIDEQEALLDDFTVQLALLKAKAKDMKKEDEDEDDDDDDDIQDEDNKARPIFRPFMAGKLAATVKLSEEDRRLNQLLNMSFDVTKEVPNFDGSDLQKYTSFRQAWETVDNKMEQMGKTPSEKLIQLKRCLSSTPLKYIGSLPDHSDENYLGALNLLDNYYYDNRVTAKLLIDKMLDLPKMSNEVHSMEETFFELTTADQILKGLALTGNQCRTLLFTSICETKLNNFMAKQWAKKCDQMKDPTHPLGHSATEQDLFEILKNEIKNTRTLYKNTKQSETPKKEEKRKKEEHQSLPGSFSTTQAQVKSDAPYCIFCKKRCHYLINCTVLKPLTVEERRKLIRDKKLCSMCFSSEHFERNCSYSSCVVDNCGQRHNKMLHIWNNKTGSSHYTQSETQVLKDIPAIEHTSCSASLSKSTGNQKVSILQSCLAWAVSPTGEKFKARIFLDPGSEICLIRRQLAQTMGLSGRSVTLQMKVTGGGITSPSHERDVGFCLESLDGRYKTQEIEATTIKEITATIRDIPFGVSDFPHLDGLSFTEHYPRTSSTIDILIGIPEYNNLVTGLPIKGKPNEPVALPTRLGYVLSGSYESTSTTEPDRA